MENNLSFPFSSSLSLNTNNIFATENIINNNVRLGYYNNNNNNINLMKTSSENNGNGFLGLMSEMDRKVVQGNNNNTTSASVSQISLESENKLGNNNNNNNNSSSSNNNDNNKKIKGEKKAKKPKYAFQTRSQVDILDDGYRWRKYGQKAVKNNKFPRSYYRCTHQGCNVKKQVQRLTKDEGIVVTTYEGIHSHSIEKSTDNFEHILTQMQIYSSY